MESRIHREVYVRFGGEEVGNLLLHDGKAPSSLAYYISELLGKGTIDKKSSGETKGRQGSSSRNFDVLGRELLTPDEARKLDNKKCLIFIRGFDPVIDNKFVPFAHPAFNQTADGKGAAYVHVPALSTGTTAKPYELLSSKSLNYYENLKMKNGNVFIDKLTYEEFNVLTDMEMKKRFTSLDEENQKDRMQREIDASNQENELEYAQETYITEQGMDLPKKENKKRKITGADTIMNRMAQWQYSKEQKDELHKMMALGIPKEVILTVFYPETDVVKMREIRRTYKVIENQ